MKRRATKRIAVLMTLVILTCFCECQNRYNPVGIDWNICTEE